ncbi:MAG: bis(5'-nucleosyl)-tetraphosphatase (symmetrical) YqeK [Solirubrobacterales bacterium]
MEHMMDLMKDTLNEHRFSHSLGVAETAAKMAAHFGMDPEKAYLAGLVHDYGKSLSHQELLVIAEQNGLIQDPVERELPEVLHAPVGAFLLERDGWLADPEVLSAVRNHTVGDPGMTAFDMLIYLADLIEPGRHYEGIERLRQASYEDLPRGMIMGLDQTIAYCLARGRLIHPRAVALRNQLLRF